MRPLYPKQFFGKIGINGRVLGRSAAESVIPSLYKTRFFAETLQEFEKK
jgi:hypothetical protein